MEVRCNSCFEFYDDQYGMCMHCGYVEGNPPEEMNHLFPGIVLAGKYRIGAVLGFGGFGVTYKAFDEKFGTVVAIKEYLPAGIVTRTPGEAKVRLFSNSRSREYEFGKSRFLDEAKNVARFSAHDNIVNVFEFFEENNTAYIVMEFLDGCNLSEYMRDTNEKMTVEASVGIALAVCKALKDVHSQGIIHRDVSPDNIFVCKNKTIKLIDFGAARFSSGDEQTKHTVILKPGFAPPEQYEKVSAQGAWTDVYALGATLYYMVTGVKPEESTSRKINDLLVYPRKYNDELSEQLENTILKAMSIDRHLRFQTIDEFERALVGEKKVATPHREITIRKRRRLVGIGAAMLVVTLAAGAFLAIWNREKADKQLSTASISLWYSQDSTSSVKGFEQIVSDFNDCYGNIKITLRGIPGAEYEQTLTQALESGSAPTLFESTGISDDLLSGTAPLGDVLNSGVLSRYSALLNSSLRKYYFIRRYKDYFPDENRIPLSFNVPVIYENTAINELTDDFVSDATAVLSQSIPDEYTALRVETSLEKVFGTVYGDTFIKENKLLSSTATKTFQNGTLAYCFSDTSDYFDVRDKCSGLYRLIRVDSDELPCEFDNLWSVSSGAKTEQQRAAKMLLRYMLSDKAQELLHTTYPSAKCAMPINKAAAKTFSQVYDELAFIYEYTDDYVFE